MSEMIIYGASMSPYVRKVIAAAMLKEFDFKVKSLGMRDPDPEFREASPFGKIPGLRHGDYTLADSSAIIHYFEALQPEPSLLPKDAEALGKVIWWDEFADTILVSCGLKMFFNRVVSPLFAKQPGDLEEARRAECEELPPILDYFEGQVPDADGYLVGGRLTLADLAVASPFANLDHANAEVDWARYPRIEAWSRRMLAEPYFKGSVSREQAFFRKVGHEVTGRVG
ncbi:glutathione S-transferase family protein [Sphingomicrobium sediminis]|uniref:Glutathione S-transferase family protein n=1 Tax=Sphingomicrobium sediminis TaxID=2950949 RepID=A0A9X2J1Z7_9SPHN|nr:glutathione S-transferase family protein [Sphingomicrobium sediminis]MCM8557274.1 glutathione S-transferase family protein [Sphingomicrobium sediminis]